MNPSRRSARLAIGGLAVASLVALGACSSDTSGDSPTATASVQSGGVVDADQFSEVASQSDVVVVDVRTPEEFAEGHLDGAVNIDVNSPTFASEVSELDPSGTYAVYCRSGNRSATAVAAMADAGFVSLYDLDGGVVNWESAGKPLVQ